jgi:hypothetical protein
MTTRTSHVHNWMQSTSKIHLEARSHCYSRDLLPRGHNRGCSSTPPEATASSGQAQQFTPATAPQMAQPHPQTVLVREPHIIHMQLRFVSPTSACPLTLSGIPPRTALRSQKANPLGLPDSTLRERPLTAIFRSDDRNLKNINILNFRGFSCRLPRHGIANPGTRLQPGP